MKQRRWIEPQDFRDLRRMADLKRYQVAALLDVTARTIQNWETGGARIPWLAYRMLRILSGYALPGKAWEGWTIHGDRLYAPNGRWFDANSMQHIEQVFAMARLSTSCLSLTRAELQRPLQTPLKRKGATR